MKNDYVAVLSSADNDLETFLKSLLSESNEQPSIVYDNHDIFIDINDYIDHEEDYIEDLDPDFIAAYYMMQEFVG